MILITEIERLNRINLLIKRKATGTPKQLADKLRISRRHLYNIIEFMNDIGAEIKYDRIASTFYYNHSFDLEISISVNGNIIK